MHDVPNGADKYAYMLCQKCSLCGQTGATVGCSYKRCSKTYHYYCAEMSGDVIVEKLQRDETIFYLYV